MLRLVRAPRKSAVRQALGYAFSMAQNATKQAPLSAGSSQSSKDAVHKPPTRLKGTVDLFPEAAAKQRVVEQAMRRVCEAYCYREMRTPILERAQLFNKTLGESSDVVAKESFVFEDHGETVMLRPEGTAGVIRALVNAGAKGGQPKDGEVVDVLSRPKYFYYGPMFRRERPQKGRLRQFTQMGTEMLGEPSFWADIESVQMAHLVLEELGLRQHVELQINTLGDEEARQRYKRALVDFFTPVREQLSALSQKRLSQGAVFRILDSKEKEDIFIVHGGGGGPSGPSVGQGAPMLLDVLGEEAKDRFDAVLEGLASLSIPFVFNPYLWRGLDYYNDTCFEFVSKAGQHDAQGAQAAAAAAQSTVLGGGRYDGLFGSVKHGSVKHGVTGTSIASSSASSSRGKGRDGIVSGVGWAAGIERLVLLLEEKDQGRMQRVARGPSRVAVVACRKGAGAAGAVDAEVTRKAIEIATLLRQAALKGKLTSGAAAAAEAQGAIAVHYSFEGNTKRQLAQAVSKGCSLCVLVGPDEMKDRCVSVKNLDTRQQMKVEESRLVQFLQESNHDS